MSGPPSPPSLPPLPPSRPPSLSVLSFTPALWRERYCQGLGTVAAALRLGWGKQAGQQCLFSRLAVSVGVVSSGCSLIRSGAPTRGACPRRECGRSVAHRTPRSVAPEGCNFSGAARGATAPAATAVTAILSVCPRYLLALALTLYFWGGAEGWFFCGPPIAIMLWEPLPAGRPTCGVLAPFCKGKSRQCIQVLLCDDVSCVIYCMALSQTGDLSTSAPECERGHFTQGEGGKRKRDTSQRTPRRVPWGSSSLFPYKRIAEGSTFQVVLDVVLFRVQCWGEYVKACSQWHRKQNADFTIGGTATWGQCCRRGGMMNSPAWASDAAWQ